MIELLLACAPLIDVTTMAALVKQESGGAPWVINDNSGPRVYRLESQQEAVLKATELISAGHNIDMGLAQINSKNLPRLGLSVQEIFDPCKNISAGAKILQWNYEKTGSLPAALSMYNTGKASSTIGQKYAAGVYRQAGVVVPAIPGGKIANLPPLPAGAAGGSVKTGRAAPPQVQAVDIARASFSSAASSGFSARW